MAYLIYLSLIIYMAIGIIMVFYVLSYFFLLSYSRPPCLYIISIFNNKGGRGLIIIYFFYLMWLSFIIMLF